MERIYLGIASLFLAAWIRNYICTFNLLNVSNTLSERTHELRPPGYPATRGWQAEKGVCVFGLFWVTLILCAG